MPKFERIIPLFVYEDIPAAHDFLVEAFGFETGGVMRDAAGQAVHGEVRAGGAPIWLHRVTAEHGLAVAGRRARASSCMLTMSTPIQARAVGWRPHRRRANGPAVWPV